jgi:hypothetical protein
MDYLTQWRMTLAAKRMQNTGETISSIALALGYKSESAFSAAFKRQWGASPRDTCVLTGVCFIESCSYSKRANVLLAPGSSATLQLLFSPKLNSTPNDDFEKSTVRMGRDSGAICNMNGGTGCVVGSFGAARWKIRLLPFRGVPVFAVC